MRIIWIVESRAVPRYSCPLFFYLLRFEVVDGSFVAWTRQAFDRYNVAKKSSVQRVDIVALEEEDEKKTKQIKSIVKPCNYMVQKKRNGKNQS